MATYSTSVQIPYFSGLNQGGDGYNMNLRYARDMENVNVEGGGFKQMREGKRLEQELTNPIGTLAYLHRRYNTTGTLLVAVSNKKVYTKTIDGDDDWVERFSGLTDNDNDWLTYEISLYPEWKEKAYVKGERIRKPGKVYKCTTAIVTPEDWTAAHWTEDEGDPDEYPLYDKTATYAVDDKVAYPETKNYKAKTDLASEAWDASHWDEVTGTDPVDILLFTNAKDGMFCMYGDDMSVVPVATPKKFGVIARFNERVWGSAIDGDPDMLVYSRPYDPFDWTADFEIPEDGAGDVLLPTWDGDVFIGLKQFGSYLLAAKRNSIWRIYGTNPGEFVMQMQYGGGTIEENTLVTHNQYAYMLGRNGMMRYDGNVTFPFLQEQVQDIFKHVNKDYLGISTAAMRGEVYCLALPVNESTTCNAILEYDTANGLIAYRTEVSVASFLQVDDRLFYTSATYPGRVYELRDDVGLPLPVLWVSGWQDLGLKRSIKSAFVLYMKVEAETPLEIRVGIRTEKKLKEKIYTLKPGKPARLHLNLQGRYFRIELKSYSAVPFAITGGIQMDLELDPD